MKKTICIFLTLLISFTLVSCKSTDNYTDDLASLKERIEDLENENKELQEDLKSMQDDYITDDEFDRFKNSYQNDLESLDNNGVAIAALYEQGYCICETNIGTLLISIVNAEEYLNGLKVNLNIGNTTNVQFVGLDMKITPSSVNQASNNSYNQTQVTINDTIYPGKWNSVEIILPDININNAKYLIFEVEGNTIRLN